MEPARKRVGVERMLRPLRVREAKRDVVGQRVAAQQQLEALAALGLVRDLRAAPTKHALEALAQHRGEAKLLDVLADRVVEDQFRVAKRRRSAAEQVLDRGALRFYLGRELVLVHHSRKRVLARLTQELHAVGLCQLDEAVECSRRPVTQLLDHRARERERATELTVRAFDRVEQHAIHRQVAALRDSLGDHLVERVVEVRELLDAIARLPLRQSVRLVHLEVEDDVDHAPAPIVPSAIARSHMRSARNSSPVFHACANVPDARCGSSPSNTSLT